MLLCVSSTLLGTGNTVVMNNMHDLLPPETLGLAEVTHNCSKRYLISHSANLTKDKP